MYFLFLFSYAKTVEAERISVDHVAHLKPSDGGSAATQCKICLYSLIVYRDKNKYHPPFLYLPKGFTDKPFVEQWQLISQEYIVLLRCLIAE